MRERERERINETRTQRDKDDHATSCCHHHQADCLPFVLVHQCLSVLLKEASTLYLSHTLDIYCFEDLGMCILCIVYFAYILVSIATTYICSLVTFSLSLHYRMLMMRHLQHKIDHSKMIHLQIHISHFFLWFPQFLIYTCKIVNNLLSSDII